MLRLPKHLSKRRIAAVVAGGGLAVIVLLFLLIYFVIFPTSSPKPFRLTTSRTGDSTGSTAHPLSARRLAGRWQVVSGSQAGYRVREKLAFLPAQSDAVGRTSVVTGAATLTDSRGAVTVASASFNVAVNTLKSDRSERDEHIRTIGLESDRYPTATFLLSAPLTLPASARGGGVVHATATGTLEIHGTSRPVSIPVEMSLSGSTLAAAGSLTFPWSEFGMSAPSIGGFVNVTDKATMEFDLRLRHE